MADNTYLQKGLEVHLSDVNVLELVSLHFILIFPISCPCFFFTRKGCVEQRGVTGRSGELGDGGSASDRRTG